MEKYVISIVIVALNEERALPKLLESIVNQDYNHKLIEILLVDSNSSDGTKDIMNKFALRKDFKRIVVLNNKKIIQSSGWNVGIKNSTGDLILRLDAHAILPSNFISMNIKCIDKGESICGGKVKNYTINNSKWSMLINSAEDSMFGGSIASFRHQEHCGYVKTIAFCVYKKEVFDKVGLFNESLLRTEDNEMHYRIRKEGYKFYYNPQIVSYRETRPTLKRIIKQKYGNGFWIGKTIKVCPRCISWYHLIPFIFILSIIITTILMFLNVPIFAIVMWILYCILTIIMTILSLITDKNASFYYIILPLIFLLLHISYGFGTFKGLLDFSKQ